jgi:hypothetical protein
MAVKELSSTWFIVAHVAVIVFHIVLGAIVLAALGQKTLFHANSTTVIRVCMMLLILMSTLGLVPILMNREYLIR